MSHKHCVTVAWLDVFIIDLCFICFPHLSTQVIKTKAGSTMLCLCVSVCVFVNAVLRALSWMHSDLKLMSRFPFKAPRAHAHLSLSFHFLFFFHLITSRRHNTCVFTALGSHKCDPAAMTYWWGRQSKVKGVEQQRWRGGTIIKPLFDFTHIMFIITETSLLGSWNVPVNQW